MVSVTFATVNLASIVPVVRPPPALHGSKKTFTTVKVLENGSDVDGAAGATFPIGLTKRNTGAAPFHGAPDPPTRDYLALVASESADQVALVRFGSKGIRVERTRYVGWLRNEIAGPHDVSVAHRRQSLLRHRALTKGGQHRRRGPSRRDRFLEKRTAPVIAIHPPHLARSIHRGYHPLISNGLRLP